MCNPDRSFLLKQMGTQAIVDGGIQIRADVRDALERGFPVVALESTIISHGTSFST